MAPVARAEPATAKGAAITPVAAPIPALIPRDFISKSSLSVVAYCTVLTPLEIPAPRRTPPAIVPKKKGRNIKPMPVAVVANEAKPPIMVPVFLSI